MTTKHRTMTAALMAATMMMGVPQLLGAQKPEQDDDYPVQRLTGKGKRYKMPLVDIARIEEAQTKRERKAAKNLRIAEAGGMRMEQSPANGE